MTKMRFLLKHCIVIPICFLFFNSLTAQDFHLSLQDILHNSTDGRKAIESIQADAKGGEIIFSVIYNSGTCPERFRFKWEFEEDLSIINCYDLKRRPLNYTFYSERLDGNCGVLNPSRNPFAVAGCDDSGFSRIVVGDKTDTYLPRTRAFMKNSERLYFRKEAPVRKTGILNGSFDIYTQAKYDGSHTFFFLNVSGSSNRGVKEDGVDYQVVYMFKINAGPATTSAYDPCTIQAPDCSCCPGTVPIWNFNTNRGDCICPEGTMWNKVSSICEPIKN